MRSLCSRLFPGAATCGIVTSEPDMSRPTAAALLLVEDDPQIVRAIAPAFEVSGYAVTVAATGRQAIEMLDEQRWDALIVDLGLPDLDGKAVIAHLRSQGNTPVIVISARNSPSEVEAARDAGANGFMHKPFRTPQLLNWVNQKMTGLGSGTFAEV
jgi:two-component system KDP operon response regulator KdpE